ncbi:hypothetical protein ETI10_01730 [Macrococcoides goetzii]|nr:hypothetical protein [Macrococcus goetzii]TDM41832.1 hypothetical protein ETI10_01730 [Macrococcus goetzii]
MTIRNNKGQFVKGENIVDKTGERHGRLTVLSLSDKRSGRKTYWNCICDCGNEKVVRSDSLKVTQSCGCLKREQDMINLGIINNHGMTKHPLYGRWNAMINRCENNKTKQYKSYGARGIKVCEDWKDILKFIDWAEDNGFEEGLTLERIDVNGNYEPGNCEWIPMDLQHYNKTTSVHHTYKGETLTTMQWTHKYNIPLHEVSRYKKKDIPFTDLIEKYKDNTEVTS